MQSFSGTVRVEMDTDQQELADIVKTIIDANVYMVLGTSDDAGRPWVSPVFFSQAGYREFYWVSNPDVKHSQNLAVRSELSIVIFDSKVTPGSGQAVYMSSVAGEVTDGLERAIEIYSDGAERRGARRWELERVVPPALYRLYWATVSEHSILCPREPGEPCAPHGRAHDHRIVVTMP